VAIVSFVTGALLLVVIIGVTVYGWVTLPPDARVPVHRGLWSYQSFVPKTVGLITWPAVSVLLFALLVATFEHASKRDHAGPGAVPLILVPVVLAIIAASEWGAIGTARRNGTHRQP